MWTLSRFAFTDASGIAQDRVWRVARHRVGRRHDDSATTLYAPPERAGTFLPPWEHDPAPGTPVLCQEATSPMTPQQFIAKWKKAELSERSACQQHFLDLCELLQHPKPAEVDPNGTWFTFERGADKVGGGKGWADVWLQAKFGWEYKGKHKDLKAA